MLLLKRKRSACLLLHVKAMHNTRTQFFCDIHEGLPNPSAVHAGATCLIGLVSCRMTGSARKDAHPYDTKQTILYTWCGHRFNKLKLAVVAEFF